MPRVLETVLTGRNLLSPVLASAGRDVVAFNSTVAGANEKAAASATASARVQQASADTTATASSRAAAASTAGAGAQSKAATEVTQANARTAESATASSTAQSRAHAKAAESATVSARVQGAANRSLAASNGLLGTSLTPLTAGLTAGALALAYAGYRGMEFATAMSQVQAASQASASDMGKLKDAAIDAGAKTQYSAVEAAQGITEMSKAGVSAKDILGGGLTGALNLAAAGQISVADAAETGATALSVFRLEGNQMSHVADLLAAGAGKAQGSVGDLSQALNQSALVANQTGLSIEDTAGSLAMFASNGLIGSDAGTSFKTMLQALTPNSVAASKAMDAIGFSAYDAQGNFVGMASVADQLKTGLSGLSVEQQNATLKTIFGSDAVRAASVLYNEGGAGVREWTAKVNDSGYAARQAAQLTDNFGGDLEKLGGAFDSTMTTIGGGLQGPLRSLTQMFTGLLGGVSGIIDVFSNLPGPVQVAIGAFGAWGLMGDSVMGKLGPLKESMGGLFSSFGEALNYAKENGDGLTTVLGSVGEVGWEAAKGGLKELAKAIGPELGMAAAAYVVGVLVDGIMSVANAGDQAAKDIRDLNDSIKTADSNSARFDLVNAGLDDLRKKAAEAKSVLDSYDDQNFFNKHVWFGTSEAGQLRDARISLEHYNDEMDRLRLANAHGMESTQILADKFHLTSKEVSDLADKYGIDLTGSLTETGRLFANFYSKEYGTTPTDAANATGAAMVSAKAQTEEAAKALEQWLGNLQQNNAGFVDVLGTYTGLLDEKTQAERAAAEKTASATTSSSDSWKDYVSNVSVSLDELATKLEEQLLAQDNWRANILTITQRGGLEVGQAIAAMGQDGVQLAALMADGTDAEFQRMAALIVEDSRRGGQDAAAELDSAMKVMAAVGAAGGAATALSIATALGMGVAQVAAIAAQYGVTLASGINPILHSLGRQAINPQGGFFEADGGVVDYYANGGMEDHAAQIAPAGAWRVWAEPETGGEAYIPLASSKRDRSMNIWRETGKRLGAPEAQYFAWGGISDVPKPPSTAPYGPPISTAGDATMRTAYDETVAWMKANAPSPGSGPVGSGYQALFNMAQVAFPGVILTSGYRAGDPGYHGLGRAADLGWAGNDARHLADINRWWFDNYGSQLKELIYDGPFDDRPDIKNGVSHTYDAATRADHWTHVHTARANGGEVGPGRLFKVGENGPEWARFDAPGYVYPAATAPAAMPGYGATGGRGGQQVIVIEKRTEIAVDATGYNADQIAAKVVARQHEHEFLTGG